MKNYDDLITLVDSYICGNHSHVMREIKKLSRKDRARIVSMFRCNVDTKTAFLIAEKIILGEF